jgi:ABC-type glycerol-3-phosphate transport system substrate-binding protein
MRPRHVSRAAVGALLSLALAACGGGGGFSGGNTSDGGDKGTVRMLVNITPNLTQSYWTGLVKPFERAHPGVHVKIEAPTGKSVADTLPQQLAAGNAPDVVEQLTADPTRASQLLDLTDQPWAKDTPLVRQAAVGGRIYTVGVGEQAQSLIFYNKTAFAKAGIQQPPKTLDELTQAMGRLKAAGYLPLQTAGDFVTGLQLLQLADPSLAQSHPQWYQDIKAGRLKVGESLLPHLRLYKSWIAQGYVDKNAMGLKYPDSQTRFFAGKAAMYIMGSWFTAAESAAKKDFEVGVFPAPVQAGQRSPGPQGATMAAPYMILKSAKHRALALKLVQWLVTDKSAVTSQLQQDGNFRPGFDRRFTPLERQVQQILDAAPATVPQGEGYGDNTLPNGFNDAWNTQVQGLYVGRSPEKVAAAVDQWVASRS